MLTLYAVTKNYICEDIATFFVAIRYCALIAKKHLLKPVIPAIDQLKSLRSPQTLSQYFSNLSLSAEVALACLEIHYAYPCI